MKEVFTAYIFILIFCLSPFAYYADRTYADNGDVNTNNDVGGNVTIDVNDGLRAAIIDGNIEKAKLFIENGADVNKAYTDGSTPLLDVIEKSNGAPDMVGLLLKHGANPKARPNGFSALSLALKANNEALIQMLRPYAEEEEEFYGLATYFWYKQEGSSALEYTDKSLSLNPVNGRAWELKGSIYILQKNLKGAETAYAKALEVALQDLKADKSADNYNFAVRDALLSENFNEALRLGADGLSYFPKNSFLAVNVGHALLFLDNRKEAIAFYRKSYNKLKQHAQSGDQASQQFSYDFSFLKERFPDKLLLIGWAEKRLLEPFDFPYGEIPFGEEKEAVFDLVGGADVKKDDAVLIGVLDPILKKELGEGLYDVDLKTRVSPTVAEKHVVTYDKWDAIERIDLFFTSLPRQEWDRTLFLVSKYFKEQSGKLDGIFSAMQADLSKELLAQPVVHDTKIQTQSGPLPAKLAVWKLNDMTVVFDVVNVSSATAQLRIVYVSQKGWDRYLNALHVSKPR